MNLGAGRVQCGENLLRAFDLSAWSARHDEEAIRLQIGLVLKHAVLGYARTVERRAQSAQPADDDCVLDPRGDNGCEVAERDDVSHDRDGHEEPSKEKPPESPPERAA